MSEQGNFQAPLKQQSRLGVASVVIGVFLPVLLVFFIVSGAFLGTRKGTTGNDIVAVYMVVSLTFPLIHLAGLIFGVIGIFSKKTKKLFPIIGTLINGFLLLTGVLIIMFFVANLKFKG